MIIHSIPAWIELVTLASCIGLLFCRLWVLPRADGDGLDAIERRLWPMLSCSIAVMLMAGCADLLVRAADMSGRPVADAVAVLPAVLFKTHFGRVWTLRISLLVIALAAVVAGRRLKGSRPFQFSLLMVFFVVAFTGSAVGHAADAGDFSLQEFADWLHLLAASFWGGGLFALTLVILPPLMSGGETSAPLFGSAAAQFSKIAGFAVAAVAATAVYNGVMYVGGPDPLLKTAYGRIVIVKIVLLLVLMNLGAFNRYVSVPLLREWGGLPSTRRSLIQRIVDALITPYFRRQGGLKTALRFRRGVALEAVLMVVVLFCAALLRHEIPARHLAHMGHTGGKEHPMHMDGGSGAEQHRHDAGSEK